MKLIMSLTTDERTLNSVSLTEVLKILADDSVLGKVIDDIVYSPDLLYKFIRTSANIFPDIALIGNSFIQYEDLSKLSEYVDLVVLSNDSEDEDYQTGNLYTHMYKQLKKDRKQVILNPDMDFTVDCKDEYELLLSLVLLLVWRETHMGEITDAITNAINNTLTIAKSVDMKEDSSDLEDRVKLAMEKLGMDGTSQPVRKSIVEEKPKVEDRTSEPIMNEPIEENSTNEEPEEPEDLEVCCKVDDEKLVLMIPEGVNLDRVEVAGMKFDTVTVTLPDLNSRKIQILEILSEKKPIVVKKQKPIKKATPVKIEEPKEVKKVEVELSSDLEELQAQKKDLDIQIKEARKNNDMDLVNDLRKQRRKVRAEINKLK